MLYFMRTVYFNKGRYIVNTPNHVRYEVTIIF